MAQHANAYGGNPTPQVVVGLFKTAHDAREAITLLKANGFAPNQIGAAFRDSSKAGDERRYGAGEALVAREHEGWWEKVKDAFRPEERAEHEEAVPTPRAGDRDPEDYPRGDYQYDFASEGLEGSLAAAGIPAQRAAYLTRSLNAGGAVVTVRDLTRSEEAEDILSSQGAQVRYEEVSDSSVAGSMLPAAPGVTKSGLLATYAAVRDDGLSGENDGGQEFSGSRLQLFGEVLRVHKDRIHRGEVRIRKDIVTEIQTIEVPVTREELVLERVPVSGDTPASSTNIGRDQEIRIPLSEEMVRIEKQPVVREEYLVGKRDVSEVTSLQEDVRHEEIRVNPDVDSHS